MDEQRPGVQVIVTVEVLPLVGRRPRAVAIVQNRVRRRPQGERIQHDRLAVTFPAVMQKPRFRFPALHDRGTAILRPAPVDAAVEGVGNPAQLCFLRRCGVEVMGGCQGACDE